MIIFSFSILQLHLFFPPNLMMWSGASCREREEKGREEEEGENTFLSALLFAPLQSSSHFMEGKTATNTHDSKMDNSNILLLNVTKKKKSIKLKIDRLKQSPNGFFDWYKTMLTSTVFRLATQN